MSQRTTLAILGGILLIGVVPAQPRTAGQPPQSLADFSTSIEELARTAGAAVVRISVRALAPIDDGGQVRAGFVAEQQATGSGVIVDPDGYIITNAHVVRSANRIDVSVIDTAGAEEDDGGHKHYSAETVGIDRETDLALLKIDAHNLPALSFVDSGTLKQGQLVVALGSPLGLENSLTVGVISSPARYLGPENPSPYIQTDASINPGNSGGALLDSEGHIAGINTMIMSQSGGNEGIGFAIPANTVRRVYEELRRSGSVRRGAIGVVPQDVTRILASALGLDHDPAVILSDIIRQGSAEAAGLAQGDLILAVDGKPLRDSRQLIAVIFSHAIGDEITLDIERDKQRLQKKVILVERPKTPQDLNELASRDAHLIRDLGILALTVDEKVTPILPDLRRLHGVAVAAIPAEFAALNPGLVPGDVIYEFNGAHIESLDQFRNILSTRKSGDPIALLVERDHRLIYVAFELE